MNLEGENLMVARKVGGQVRFIREYKVHVTYDDDESSANEAFDRKLRAKHTKACKYMRVSTVRYRD